MPRCSWYLFGLVIVLEAVHPAAAQAPPAAVPAAVPDTNTVGALEDLRVLAIINALEPTREQLNRLTAVAESGREGVSAINAEAKTVLDRQRETLLTARERLVHGGVASPAVDAQVSAAGQSAEETRTRKTEALVASLAQRVRAILTPEQARLIESELAPTGDQPWRLYARGVSGPAGVKMGSARLPSDPGTWRKELRDLRTRAAAGNPQAEADAFVKKLTRGLRSGTPLFDQAAAQARAFASQALSLAPAAYSQREWSLARAVAQLNLDALTQQRSGDGKERATFAADRWLVEQVLLSPRAVANLQARADAS